MARKKENNNMSIVITIESFNKGYQGITTISLDKEGNREFLTTYKKDGIQILHHEQTIEVQNNLDKLVLGDDIYSLVSELQSKLIEAKN